jgi:hypothetical protein
MTNAKPAYVRVLPLLLVVVILAGVGTWSFLRRTKDPPATQGTVLLRSVPPGATVYIDDERQDRKTDAEFVLKAGKHKLQVELEDFDLMDREVEVQAGQEATEIFRLKAAKPRFETIPISSLPPGATVSIDGKIQKKKTPAAFVFKVGRHRVKVEHPGYEPAEDRNFIVEVGDAEAGRNPFFNLNPIIPPRPLRPFKGERNAARSLRTELAPVAGKIAAVLKDKDLDSVALGDFTAPKEVPGGGGPLIAKVLGEELVKQGLTIKETGGVKVKGEYHSIRDKKSQLAAVRIQGTVVDRKGKVLYQFDRNVFGESVIAALLGVTVQLPLTGDEKGRAEALAGCIAKPHVHIKDNAIAAGASRPYAIEVLAAANPRANYEVKTPENKDGLAYVPIAEDQVFGVRLINHADHEAAVTLTIDGLNTFAFSAKEERDQPRYSQWFVGPKSSVTVKGWYYDPEQGFIAFAPGKFPKLGGFVLPASPKVGTITATFAASWFKWNHPPVDEPKYKVWDDETTRGPRASALPVETKVNYGVIRDVVSVRLQR